ncbi:hypothetical protein BDV59DRAFT_174140 [Aspergillus ambiguus]|uniref:uncharacterized protein n=1 Tax=Aspergillus ambiguus TaxID=176160 RepID=UPI003CCDD60A
MDSFIPIPIPSLALFSVTVRLRRSCNRKSSKGNHENGSEQPHIVKKKRVNKSTFIRMRNSVK